MGQKFDVVPKQQEVVGEESWEEWDEKAVLDIVEVVKEFDTLRAAYHGMLTHLRCPGCDRQVRSGEER